MTSYFPSFPAAPSSLTTPMLHARCVLAACFVTLPMQMPTGLATGSLTSS